MHDLIWPKVKGINELEIKMEKYRRKRRQMLVAIDQGDYKPRIDKPFEKYEEELEFDERWFVTTGKWRYCITVPFEMNTLRDENHSEDCVNTPKIIKKEICCNSSCNSLENKYCMNETKFKVDEYKDERELNPRGKNYRHNSTFSLLGVEHLNNQSGSSQLNINSANLLYSNLEKESCSFSLPNNEFKASENEQIHNFDKGIDEERLFQSLKFKIKSFRQNLSEDKSQVVENHSNKMNELRQRTEVRLEKLSLNLDLENSSSKVEYLRSIGLKPISRLKNDIQSNAGSKFFSQNPSKTQTPSFEDKLKLLNLDGKVFDGDAEKFHEFLSLLKNKMRQFDFTDDEKLKILIKMICPRLQQRLALIGDRPVNSYEKALVLLRRLCKKAKDLTYSYANKIIHMKAMSRSSNERFVNLLKVLYEAEEDKITKKINTSVLMRVAIAAVLKRSERRQCLIGTNGLKEFTIKHLIKFLEGKLKEAKIKKPRNNAKRNRHCPLCTGPHLLRNCSRFNRMNLEKRLNTVRKLGLCENCFSKKHQAQQCLFFPCKTCRAYKHHKIHSCRSVIKQDLTDETEEENI